MTKVPNAHGENKRVSVTKSENEQKSKSSQNVTPLSVTNKEVSVTNEVSVTDNVTVKDSETRQWLIQQFKDEGKQADKIHSIMTAQDRYHLSNGHYFIPARMLDRQV